MDVNDVIKDKNILKSDIEKLITDFTTKHVGVFPDVSISINTQMESPGIKHVIGVTANIILHL